jgi:DNA repair protein RecN (Recombination protein N)
MLRELRIENLAIIEKLDLEFGKGLITLTGETGAGKSIVLSGINLLIGEKANVELLRDGEEYLLAEGVFETSDEQAEELKEMGIEVEDREIIVRRTLDKNGKGKAFVNGRRFPVSSLKEIMGTLVDLVGQHSHQMLLNKNNHIKLLDKFLGEDAQKLKIKLEEIVNKHGKIKREIVKIDEIKKEISDKRDFYEFQLGEINSLELNPGEDTELEDEYKKLFNAGNIKENLINSFSLLKDGEQNAMSFIYNSKKFLESVMKYGKEFEEVQEKLEKIYYDLEDVVYTVQNLEEDIDTDELRLNEVVDRLDKINNLKRKYGFTIEEIIDYRDDLQEKLDTLSESDFQEKKFLKEIEELNVLYKEHSDKLSEARKESARLIEEKMEKELKYLSMKDSIFEISFTTMPGMGRNGSDHVEFLITTNKGQSLKPLSKIASGGEVSRIMLALKSIFSVVDNVPILVFDEIDTGVGGETVRKIASKLKDIGENSQVVCITHSPAIASKSSQQFYIEKKTVDEKTVTTVRELDYQGRIDEIGRMLAGENITEAVLKHAKEILDEV